MKKIILLAAAGLALAMAACSGSKAADQLQQAAATADGLISKDYDHNVEVNAENNGLDVAIRLTDSLVKVEDIGSELFDALASLNLKACNADSLTALTQTLHKAKADVKVELIGTDRASEEFTLSPTKIIKLQGAKLTQLNPSALKTQITELAEAFCPNPAAHAGAKEVEVSISKSFLEYNVVWSEAKAYGEREQGWLTLNYFNPLKMLYMQVNDGCPGLIQMMTELGIDGVRMVYSAPDSDRELRQAFPWRELEKPIEEFPVIKK